MKTTTKWTAVILAASGVLIAAAFSSFAADRPAGGPGAGARFDQARPPMDGPGRGGGGPEALFAPPGEIMRLGQQLNLTDQQREAIREMAKTKMDAIREQMELIPPLHKQLADAMLSNTPDAAAAKELAAKINDIKTQIAGLGIDFWTQVRTQLTAEQNAKLTELLRQRTMRPWQPGGPRRGPGAGPNPPPPGQAPPGQMPPPGEAPEPDPGL